MKIDNPKVSGELTLIGGGSSTLSGSFSGSFQGDGSQLTGIVSSSFATTASYAVSASHEITLETSSSFADSSTSASYAVTASHVTDAEGVGYDNTSSNLTATDVQDAIDEVSTKTIEIDSLADQRLREAFRKEKSTDVAPSLLLDFAGDKQLDPRITYSRASTATYYDGQTVAKAEENLVTYSQEFDNVAWNKSNGSTVDANVATSPDGTTTSDRINLSTNVTSRVEQPVSKLPSKDYVFSVWLKSESGTQNVLIRNLSANTTTVSVTTSWQRFTHSFNDSSTLAFIAIQNSSSTQKSVLAWGAQVEQRSTVTAYTPTTTQPITNYIPVLQTASSGEPRFDHDPVTGESKGLLIEEQRTNLLTYSESFDDSDWSKTNASIDSNVIIAPDGTLTGDKIIPDTSNNTHQVRQLNISQNPRALSIYVKAGEYRYIAISHFILSTVNNGPFITFDAIDGVFVRSSGYAINANIDPEYVGNGWWKISFYTTISNISYDNFAIGPATGSGLNDITFAGDGYSGIYIWGAQLEEGSFPTSYIKTEGSQVTRVADSASMTGTNFSDWYRQDEGTLYADIEPAELSATSGVVINDNTTDNRIRLATASASNQGLITANGSAQATLDGGTPATDTSMLLAMAYNTDDFALSLDGATAATGSSGIVPVVSQLQIGVETTTIGNMRIKQFAYYPIRLADATLESITT